MMNLHRRKLLVSSALSFGSLSLKSLVTGLPAVFVAGAYQQAMAQSSGDAKHLIISHLRVADPVNTNVPGCYADPNNANDIRKEISHPGAAGYGGVNFNLGSVQVRAAQVWADLPEDLRARMAFWHQATRANAHPDFPTVRRFNGSIKGQDGTGSDELDALLAQELQPMLGCLTPEPISVGGNSIQYGGKGLQVLQPNTIKNLFRQNSASVEQMVNLRDQILDDVYQNVKTSGTPAQRKFLDAYATSKEEAKNMGDSLGALITDVNGNGAADQMKVAVALTQLNVTPIVTVGVGFGGDNHFDEGLTNEVSQTNSGVPAIASLWARLKAANMEDKVIFTMLNTFGRDLITNGSGGRDHNPNHHVMPIFGVNIKPGVVGGVEPNYRKGKLDNFKATGINSSNGASTNNSDIPFEDTLVSSGKTLAKALGIPNERINERFDGGKIISGALV